MKVEDLPEVKETMKDMGFADFNELLAEWPDISNDTLYFCLEDYSNNSDNGFYWYCGPLNEPNALEDTLRTDKYLEGLVKELDYTEDQVEIGLSENCHEIKANSLKSAIKIAQRLKNRIAQDFKVYIDPDSYT